MTELAVRLVQARQLVRPLGRAITWLPFLGAGVGAALLLVMTRDGNTAIGLHLCAVVVAAGATFAFDDDASVTLAASPSPLAFRRLLRVVEVGVGTAVVWCIVLAVATVVERVPMGAPTRELAAWFVVGLALAALVGGAEASPLLLALAVVSVRLPQRWALYAPGGALPGVTARWLGLALAAGVLLAWASRDPAARRRRPATPRTIRCG